MIYFRKTAIARCYHVHSRARENWKVFTSPPNASAQPRLSALALAPHTGHLVKLSLPDIFPI